MTRTLGLAAAMLLAVAISPCPAQMGGGGMGMGGGMGGMGGGMRRSAPAERWKVQVASTNGQSVTGQLLVESVPIECDLGYYLIKPEKVKAVEFEPGNEEPNQMGGVPRRKGAVVTTSGERIAGILSIPHQWGIETELGHLKPEVAKLKSITFVERVAAKPGDPADPAKPVEGPMKGH